MTSKPLIDAIFEECRASWWLLVLTGMVWGSEEMWQTLGDTIIGFDRHGNPRYFVNSCATQKQTEKQEHDIELSDLRSTSQPSSSQSPETSHSTTIRLCCSCTISIQMKKYLCRIWYILVRIIVALSIVLILLSVGLNIKYGKTLFDDGILFFYCTMFIQALATIITSQLMMQRLQKPAPVYCVSAFRGSVVTLCILFFILTIGLACLMFILADIQSSRQLLDQLMNKLEFHITSSKQNSVSEEISPLMQTQQGPRETFNTATERMMMNTNSSWLPITLPEYEEVRSEICKRVQESWYTNTFAVTVAALNLANLVVGAFTYLNKLDPYDSSEIILQLSKEIVFLFIVFCYCAELNAKSVRFNDQLGSYLAWYERPMHVWHYACLNPISFELGGYVVTWSRIAIQLASIGVGILVGFARQFIMG
jgi:hypothetical protein